MALYPRIRARRGTPSGREPLSDAAGGITAIPLDLFARPFQVRTWSDVATLEVKPETADLPSRTLQSWEFTISLRNQTFKRARSRNGNNLHAQIHAARIWHSRP